MVEHHRTLHEAKRHRETGDNQKPFSEELTVAHNIPE
jgi:hypothetical protein